jgi:hypothetical protein
MMTEERKILEMLQAGQINLDEALGLLEALRDSRDEAVPPIEMYLSSEAIQKRIKERESARDEEAFSKELKDDFGFGGRLAKRLRKQLGQPNLERRPGMFELSGKTIKFNLHRAGDDEKTLNLQAPLEYARRLEGMIPQDIQELISAQGITLHNVLATVHPLRAPEGNILNLHVAGDKETTITLEVTS